MGLKNAIKEMFFIKILQVLVVLIIVHAEINAQSLIRIGIIKDAGMNEFEILSTQVKAEIEALTKGQQGAVFKEISAAWDPESVNENIQSFFNDQDIDIIVTLGYLTSDAAARFSSYPKPVIAATILDQEFQNLPMQPDNSSGMNNFSYIESLIRLKSDMFSFSRMFDFDHLAVVIPQELYEVFPSVSQFLKQDVHDFDISFVPVDMDVISYPLLPFNADAAFVFPLIQHSQKAIEELFDELNNRRIPSLAIGGPGYLEKGATLTLTPQFTLQHLARQVALRVIKASESTNLAEVPVSMDVGPPTPIVNMKSLRQIDQFPEWSFLENAILMNVAKIPGERLGLRQAIAQALENNLQGKITDKDLLIAEQDVRIARSNVLPQVEISGTGVQMSKNLVEASMGQQGEYTITGSVELKQVIYSEPVFASIAIKKLAAENTKHFNKQTMLDIVLNLSKAYVSLLFAKNNLQIQNENVYVTFQNLEMAKAKEESGQGSISDVNRWTSELSLNKMDLNDAQAGYEAAMYQLNEKLNMSISQMITTTDSASIDEIVVLNQQILSLIFDNPNLTEKYANFLVDEMRDNSPELQQLLTAEKIIDQEKTMHRRQMYIPEVAVFGNADQAFLREGTIENPKLPVPPPPDDITWNFGVRFSLPLYDGGRKKAALNRSLIELDKINWQKKDLLNNLEGSIRSNVQLLKASYRELDLSKKAAQAAEDNFKLIQDSYAQGVANVIQLIDAQKVMTQTKHLAISAYYQYILDFILTERMQGKFSFLDNEMEREMYTTRLLNYLTEKP